MTSTSTSPAPVCSRPRWPRCCSDPALKAQADNPTIARLWYTSINPTVKPFDNIECRKAVMYAMDHDRYQTAYGGEFAGGDIATTIMPPQIPGYQKFDLYPAGADNKGDVDKAKEALTKCGQPERLRDQHGLPGRAARRRRRPPRRSSRRWPGWASSSP